MPHDFQPYTPSVNPTRRAKQSSLRTILPQPTSPPSTDASDFEPNPVPTPAKRGRKPGPLSRAARETQRKLNHSIIEKARRTKINDALTILRRLVPADYGQPSLQPGDEEEEGKRKKGKKEEKEKEYKLEILERTVIFLQDVLKRVQVLEADASSSSHASALCAKCTAPLILPPSSPSRRPEELEPSLKRKRSISSHTSRFNLDIDTAIEPSSKRPRPCSSPLPPISSWLPNPIPTQIPQIDPQLLNINPNPPQASQLPSPPLSVHFTPQQHPLLSSSVPTLHLGASTLQNPSSSSGEGGASTKASSCSPPTSYRTPLLPPPPPLLSPRRTPEDESAASLLLQISASGSATPLGVDHDASWTRTRTRLSSVRRGSGGENGNVQAQTPGSMLGLVQVGTMRMG